MTTSKAGINFNTAAITNVLLLLCVLGPDEARAQPTPTAELHIKGNFGAVQTWPVIGINAVVLPDGRVLTWSSHDDNSISDKPPGDPENRYSHADVWDPVTKQHKVVDNFTTNLFCAGQSFLPDGRLLVAGGHDGDQGGSVGKPDGNIYDWRNDSWTHVTDMSLRRWYPTLATLPTGDILVVGGDVISGVQPAPVPEVWEFLTSTWRRLLNIDTSSPAQHPGFYHQYPFLHVTPKLGKVFITGPMPVLSYMDPTGNGAHSYINPVNNSNYTRTDSDTRVYGFSVQYKPNKILVGGGGVGIAEGGTGSLKTTNIIDLKNEPDFTAQESSPMHHPRTFANATLMPDGRIFVNGGNTSAVRWDDSTAVYESEIWDPITEQWTPAATAQVVRGYHSTSVLLKSGKILTMGGGLCGNCVLENNIVGSNHDDAEIYTPPYLFKKDGSGQKAPRPKIVQVPGQLNYGEGFRIDTAEAATIAKVSLIGLSSTTHAFNMNQRYIQLQAAPSDAKGLLAIAPANSNIAPPGYYWLFIVDNEGVPSTGKSVHIGGGI